MRKKKGNLLQRTMALLLSVVLAAGMALDAVPLTALASENAGGGYNATQESVSENALIEEETGAEADGEETGADSAAEKPGDTETPVTVPEGQDGEPEQKPTAEEADDISGGDLQPDKAASPQKKAMRAAGIMAQAEVVASGTDWKLDADGKLTIESDAGMINWESDEDHSVNKKEIQTVELLDGVTVIKWNAFGESSLTDITIPSSVTEIESYAFTGSRNLTNITIPEYVTSIGDSAFKYCGSLESVTVLGETPAAIGEGVFSSCKFVTDNTKGIKVPAGTADTYKAEWTEWADYITDGTDGTGDEFIASGTDWTLDKDGKLTIESDAGMTNWESDEDHYTNKKEIQTVELLDGVTFIKESAFFESSLTAITIPSSVTKIEDGAFWGSQSLTNITIPESVTSMGWAVFEHCESLESVTVLGETPAAIGEGVFSSCKFVTDNTKGIKVPAGTADTYKAAWTEWADYITDGTEDTGDEFIASGTDWTLDKDGKLTIESQDGMTDWWNNGKATYSEQVILAEIKDGVTSIPGNGENTPFSGCSNMKGISLPDTVTYIAELEFSDCTSLVDVGLPPEMTSIEVMMFYRCTSLERIDIPSKVKSIEDGAFQSCSSLREITIPDGVTTIGASAFYRCSSLRGITIPNSVTSISDAFGYCSSLTDITIPDSVTSIENKAFWNCSSLETVTMLGSTPPTLGNTSGGATAHFAGCKFVADGLKGIKVPAGTADTYKAAWTEWADYITDGTEDTGDEFLASGKDWTLDKDGKLTIESQDGIIDWYADENGKAAHKDDVISAEIKEGVEYIQGGVGGSVFSGCINMTSITIAAGVNISDFAFCDCSKLTDVTLPSDLKKIAAAMFQNCSSLTRLEIPAGVKEIGTEAFSDCSSLTAITIPDSVISIGGFAFKGCGSLTGIVIPSGMISVQDAVFEDCSALSSVTFQGDVTDIGRGAFSGCSGLTAITIPDSVTSIGFRAFQNCSSLQSVTMEGSTPPVLDTLSSGATELFAGCKFVTDGVKGIKVPEGTADTYKAAWTEWADYITDGTDGAEDEVIASGEGWTLDKNGKLTIESDEGMADWVENHFVEDRNQKVISAEIKEGVTGIAGGGTGPDGAFSECSNLTGITIPSSVTDIGGYAFYECSKLTDIKLPENLTAIGRFAFCMCSSLTGVEIPASVPMIEDYAFSECSSLEKVTFLSDTTAIGQRAFSGCSSLTKIELPAGLTAIATGTFSKCSSLTGITVPAGVTSIGPNAFLKCSSLESVTMQGSTPPALGAFESGQTAHFKECKFVTDKTQGIKVPAGTADAYKAAWTEWKDYIVEGSAPATPTDKDKVEAAKKAVEAALEDITVSNATTKESLAEAITEAVKAALEKAGIDSTDVTITVEDFAKTEATADTEGSVTATIKIASGTETAEVPVAGTIDKLPVTPADKVAAAKKAVEDALADITMTNATTKETLETAVKSAVETALEAAGVDSKDVTLSVEDFVKTEATKDTEGSITATIKITSGTETAEVPVAGTIDKLPVTPADKVAAAKKAVEDALADITMTNATTKETLETAVKSAVETALEAAGVDSKDVTLSVEDFAKTEATKDTEGSITAAIKITSGTEIAEVPVAGTIDRLPATPADKVAAVKAAVETAVKAAIDKALADTEVTNDNAEETAAQIAALIPDAVAEALEAAGVTADEIAIGVADIAVDPASADGEGSITVTIPVSSTEDPGQTGNAVIRIPVAIPGGEEDPDKEAEEAKQAVEDALQNITITNGTTPEEIRAALEEALGDDVTVDGIEELEKVPATPEAPGRLTLQIKLVINGKTIYVTVNAAIQQPEKKTGVYVRFTDPYQMEGSTPVYKYTGLAVKPAVEVYNNETRLTPGKDYTIGYKNNTKPGTAAALTVKGKGSFSGTSNAVNFTIINADIEKDTDHPTEMTVIVNTKVAPVIMNGTKKLTTKDYLLEGEGLANGKYAAATAEGETKTLTVKGTGSYAGSSFEIKVKVIEKNAAGKLAVKVDKNYKPVYNGSAIDLSALFQKPQEAAGTDTAADPQEAAGAITVTDTKDKTKILEEGKDFSVICTSDLTNVGTVKFTVAGMGAYTGSVSKTFKISPLKVTDSTKFSVTFDEEKAYEYKTAGTEVDNLVVKYLGETESADDDRVLAEGRDYKVTYSNHKKVSGTKEAGLKITFLGNYKGSSAVQKTFRVVPAKLSADNTVVTVPDKVYGKANQAYKSVPIVTVNGVTIKASGYTVSYAWATASDAADDTKYVEDNKVKITIADGDAWAKVKVTITPKQTGSYGLAEGAVLRGEYYVRKTDSAVNLTKAKVTFFNKAGTQLKALEYNGNTFYTPAGNNAEAANAPDGPNAVYVRVMVSGAVVDPSLYDVTWCNATAKGKATVVIRGKGEATDKGMAVGSKNQGINIKAMALKGKTLKSYVENVANAMNSLKEMLFKKQ